MKQQLSKQKVAIQVRIQSLVRYGSGWDGTGRDGAGRECAVQCSECNIVQDHRLRSPPTPGAEVYYRSHTSRKPAHFALNKPQTAVTFSLTPKPPQPRDNFLTVNLQIIRMCPQNGHSKLAKTAKPLEFNTFSLLGQYQSQLKVRFRASLVNKIFLADD